MYRYITAKLATQPDKVAAALDISNAFPSVCRKAIETCCSKHAPQLWPLIRHWFSSTSTHVIQCTEADDLQTATQNKGLDQGCPLSPGL